MLNIQQQEAFNCIMELKNNYFLTGFAGTGKSYLVHSIIEECKKQNIEIAVASTTWSSAVDIGGTTYHSLFGLFGMHYDGMEIKGLKRDFNDVELIIIDEISMMWPDMLDLIDKKLRANTGYDLPFWWIKMLLVWDKKQLWPIYTGDKELIQKIQDKYWELEFYCAKSFETFKEISLIEIMRSTDEKFLWLVNRIREWDNTPLLEFQKERVDNPESVHIAFRNDWVDEYNRDKLNNLVTEDFDYVGNYYWEFKTTDCTSPHIITLKVWAKVMITKNMKEEWLTNGDMWVITNLTNDSITFLSDRLKQEFTLWKQTFYKSEYSNTESHDKNEILTDFEKKFLFTDNYELNEETWKYEEIPPTSKLYPIITGKFVQFPIRLAWAMTIHKSQWKSFNKMTLVIWRYDNRNIRQCYVGISRWRTYDNTFIKYI